jgi:hypothetical protein
MATIDDLLKAIESLRKDMVTKRDLESTKTELKQAIADSQEDTIETLKQYIETAYTMHDGRLEKIEDVLDLPHPDKN